MYKQIYIKYEIVIKTKQNKKKQLFPFNHTIKSIK